MIPTLQCVVWNKADYVFKGNSFCWKHINTNIMDEWLIENGFSEFAFCNQNKREVE